MENQQFSALFVTPVAHGDEFVLKKERLTTNQKAPWVRILPGMLSYFLVIFSRMQGQKG